MTPARKRKWYWRSILFLLVVMAAAAVLQLSGVGRYCTTENLARLEQFIRSLGIWGPLAYIAISVVAVLLLAPATPLVILAACFGAVRGIAYASIALTLGACASFLAARYALRPVVERRMAASDLFRKIDNGVKRQGWRIVMITRMVPVFPYNLQNFAYGITGIRFLTYAAVSWVCMLPAIAAYVLIAGSLISGGGDLRRILAYLGAGAVLFVLLSFIPVWIRRQPPTSALRQAEEQIES